MSTNVMVHGPAYLDRVLRVDRRLREGPAEGPIDQSLNGSLRFGRTSTLELIDETGWAISVQLPEGWPGPCGQLLLEGRLSTGSAGVRQVRGNSWADDLGGMGAGFAAALGGTLVHAVGPATDSTSRQILELLEIHRIPHQTIHVGDKSADWTLLVSSGEFGDKLAIGFRGCHASLNVEAVDPWLESPNDLRVVAGLPNPLAARILKAPGSRCRLFAPALRNMRDRTCPVSGFASVVDVLCCNRLEWETLLDREDVGWKVSILIVTEGPVGSWTRFTGPTGETGIIRMPAFPRARPPRDTNRAGEAFASTVVSSLLREGWDPGPGVIDESQLHHALVRASVAAALVLDEERFGFPDADSIERTIHAGIVE